MNTTLTRDYKRLINDDFKNEMELKDYILQNKEEFCRTVLKCTYKKHIEEYPLKAVKSLYDKPIYVDIVFVDENDMAYFVELKNPKSLFSEMMRGVGQCLSYYYMARVHNLNLADVYLVTAAHCNIVPIIIRDNSLRIKYVYYNKGQFAVPDFDYNEQ